MSILYPALYRRVGVRKPAGLVKPPIQSINNLQLPKHALLNYIGVGFADVGPKEDNFFFRNTRRHVMVEHQLELIHPIGGAIRLPVDINPSVNRYHIENRRFRRTERLADFDSDATMSLVENYSFIARKYRYPRNFMATYNRWLDTQRTMTFRMNELAKDLPNRNQFFVIQMPDILPTLSELQRSKLGMNRSLLSRFNNEGKLHILELWKFFTDPEGSIWSNISYQNRKRINIIIMDRGNWYMVNLGVIDSFKMMSEEQIESLKGQGVDVPANAARGYPGLVCAKLMLGGFIYLLGARSEPELIQDWDEQEQGGVETADVLDAENLDEKGDVVDPEPELGRTGKGELTARYVNRKQEMVSRIDDKIDLTKEDDEFWIPDNDELFEEIDKELDHLDQVQKERQARAEEAAQNNDPDAQTDEDFSDEDVPPVSTLPTRPNTPEGKLMEIVDAFDEAGMVTPKQVKFFEKTAESYKTLKAPNGQTIEEFIKVTPEMLALDPKAPANPVEGNPNNDMTYSVINDFDQKYVTEVLDRDVMSMIVATQKGGWAIQNVEVEDVDTLTDSYKSYTIRIIPVDGLPTTLRFRIPKVDDEGNYKAANVKYYYRKQQGAHLPIDKVSPTRVALTSYYGKTFITRAQSPVNSYSEWLLNSLGAKEVGDNPTAFDLERVGSLFNDPRLPRTYTALATNFITFKAKRTTGEEIYHFYVNYKGREQHFGKEVVEQYEAQGFILIGSTDTGVKLAMRLVDEQNPDTGMIFGISENGHHELGSIESLLELDVRRMPVEYSEVNVFGVSIPLGVIMAYRLGLDNFIKQLGVEHRRVPTGTRAKLLPTEYAIPFADEFIIFNKGNTEENLLIAGFAKYHKSLRNYTTHDFNSRDVFYNVLEESRVPPRYLNEVDLMFSMFIDPITEEILKDMGEPTNFKDLLLRANELLVSDYIPIQKTRIRGYERFAGIAYQEMVKAMRSHNNTPGRSRKAIDMSPFQVWNAIISDESKMQLVDINPVENLKQKEALTFSGVGGRSSESMVKSTRQYNPQDLGMVSEATVDSHKVGVNSSSSSSPLLTSLRGTYDTFDIEKDGMHNLMSTSAMLSPASNNDDLKRTNFISIQHTHGISCSGYTAPVVRTGMEQVLATRTSSMFAKAADQDGVVISVKPEGVIVRYADGKEVGYETGIRYGASGALTFPHELVANVKVGDTFKKGHVLTYNTGFFEKDYLNPSGVCWRNAAPVMVALMECPETYEDSSSISRKVAESLVTNLTTVRAIVVNFNQELHKVVKVGQKVTSEDLLCIIEDEATAGSLLFDEETIDTLRALSSQTPSANSPGVVERIEIFYNGDKEDMSPSLFSMVQESDRQLIKRAKASGKQAFTGQVDDNYRVEGNSLLMDQAVIRFYITGPVPMASGDKAVFGNQLKTVVGEVMEDPIYSESGIEIGAKFGSRSVGNRVVSSPYLIGTTSILLKIAQNEMIKAYRGPTSS